jgi:branched-chain amino acid transport system permease protein
MKTRKNCALAALCLVMGGLHLLTVLTGTPFYLTQLTMAAYYGLVIIGLAVLMGYAGQISIGHAGFFAIGGYLAAGLTTRNLTPFEEGWPLQCWTTSGCWLPVRTFTASGC